MIFCIVFLLSYTGGPDGYGYYYIDSREPEGPTFNWIDFTGGTQLSLGGDANSGLIDIVPGEFWFYGTGYSSIAVCSNGWASFTNGSANGYPTASIPQPPGFVNILAPFAGDLEPGGGIYWDTIGTKLVIGWDSIPPLTGGTVRYTFELVLDCSDSSVTFQYLKHEGPGNPWTSIWFLTGVGAEDTINGLEYPYWARRDSLAVRFYCNPNPDIFPLSIDYPGDAFLVVPDVPCSVRTRIINAGSQDAEDLSVYCIVDSLGNTVYADSQNVVYLFAHDTMSLAFDGWIPYEFVDYRLRVITRGTGDPEPSNDTLSVRVKAPGSAKDSLYYYSGEVVGGFSAGEDSVLGVRFSVDSTPVLLKYVRLWLVSEGDAPYPYPDSTVDPVVISVWEGMEEPDDIIYVDTVWRDTIPPGWVYSVPRGSLFVSTRNFWIGVKTALRGYAREAVGMDEVTDHGDRKWMYERDRWIQTDWGTGDPMVSAFLGGPAVGVSDDGVRFTFFLGRIAPNPQNRPFSVSYGVGENSRVGIAVYDVSGRKIRDIVNGERSPGVYSASWDLRDEGGRRVASGVYFLRLTSKDKIANKKFVLF